MNINDDSFRISMYLQFYPILWPTDDHRSMDRLKTNIKQNKSKEAKHKRIYLNYEWNINNSTILF